MHYEIIVFKKGRHYFTTAPNSITNLDDLKFIYADLRRRFPVEEKFILHVIECKQTFTGLNMNRLLAGQPQISNLDSKNYAYAL
jgi:hypothetical protein